MNPRTPRKQLYISWLALAACVSVGLSAGIASLLGRAALSGSLASRELRFNNPSSVVVGPDGLVVVSDSGDRRIVGMGLDGRLRFVIRGQRRERGFYNGRAIGFDAAGRFYVDDTVLDRESGNASLEAIIAFDGSGRRLGPVVETRFTKEESADVSMRFIYSQASAEGLAWFYPDDDGVWALRILPFEAAGSPAAAPGDVPSSAEREPLRFEDYDVYDSVDAAFGRDFEAYFLERSGAVLRRSGAAPMEAWYDNADGFIRFPSALASAPGGGLYALDGKRAIIRLRGGPGGAEPDIVLDRDAALRAGYLEPLAIGGLYAAADGGVYAINEAAGHVLAISADGSVRAYAGASIEGRFALLRYAALAGLAVSAIALLAAIVMAYLKLFGMKARLFLKQIAVLIPLTALAVGAIAWSVYVDMNRRVEAEVEDRLRHLAQLTAASLDAEAVDGLDPGTERLETILASEAFASIVGTLDSAVNLNQDPWNAKVFPYVYFKRGADWYIAGGFDYLEAYPYAFSKPQFQAVLDGGEDVFYSYSDSYGQWLSAMTPVRRARDGSVAAVVEASMSGDFIDELRSAALSGIALKTLGLLGLLVGVFAAFDWLLLRSVDALRIGAERVAEGDFDFQVDIRSMDEIEELGTAFNSMSGQIKAYVERLAKLGRANARFVPKEFLAQLGRESITEVGLGDQVETSMSVLFSDIRSFTSLSEQWGPSATMDMLNDYLARMGPAVRASGGFIDKYIGDAIMALFPRSPLDAVDAALTMMEKLDAFRAELAERGETDIDSGYGIHSGPLMLGVIGEEERFEGTVIADAVNLASRLESLTKFYGVRAIVSGSVKDALGGERRPLRFLDLVQVKGKTLMVRVYELVGGGDPARRAKLGTAADYVRAFELYRGGDFERAQSGFRAVLERAPGDRPTSMMLERCARYLRDGAPAAWKGVTEFHDK